MSPLYRQRLGALDLSVLREGFNGANTRPQTN
jgi:hypothetical protein